MSNYFLLLKNSFNILIGALQGKKKRIQSALLTAGFIGLIFVLFYALFFFQAYSFFVVMLPEVALMNGFLMTFIILILYEGIKVVSTSVSNDTDLLLSLPIKKYIVALAKISSKYIFDLFFTFVLLSPYIILFLVFKGFSVLFLFLGIVVLLTLPLLAVGLNYVLNFFATRFFNKTKHAGVIKSVLSVLLFLVTMGLFALTIPGYQIVDETTMYAYIYSYPPVSWFVKFVLQFNIYSFLEVFAITVLPFAVGVWLYTKNLGKSFAVYQNYSKELVFQENNSVTKTLINKEFKKYFTTPIYMMNTIIGPIFMIALTIFVLFKGGEGINQMLEMTVAPQYYFGVMGLMFLFFIGLTSISASALSLEGKNLWIIKSIPISEQKIFFSKGFVNLALTMPVSILCSVLSFFALNFSFGLLVLLILITSLMSLIVSFGGVLINLYFPKFDWTEETQVVKQSAAVLVSLLFCGFLIPFIPIGIFMIFGFLSLEVIGIITTIIYLLIFGVILFLLEKQGKRLFKKL